MDEMEGGIKNNQNHNKILTVSDVINVRQVNGFKFNKLDSRLINLGFE